jgi:hypothetical protein
MSTRRLAPDLESLCEPPRLSPWLALAFFAFLIARAVWINKTIASEHEVVPPPPVNTTDIALHVDLAATGGGHSIESLKSLERDLLVLIRALDQREAAGGEAGVSRASVFGGAFRLICRVCDATGPVVSLKKLANVHNVI